jgi:hypothetical protein
METKAIKLAKWLLGRQGIMLASPMIVRIGRHTYAAAHFTVRHKDVEQERLYALGELPPFHNQMRVCYRTDENTEYTWHLLAWQRTTCSEWREVHPFGTHFVLVLWSPVESWAADQCQKRPFRRIPITITLCVGSGNPRTAEMNEGNDQPGTS